MSRIASRIIKTTPGVTVHQEIDGEGTFLYAVGPRGKSRRMKIVPGVKLVQTADQITTIPAPNIALAGTYNSLIHNLLEGVSKGYIRRLEVRGENYKVEKKTEQLAFSLGRSHLDFMPIPRGLSVSVEHNQVTVEGNDKEEVTSFVAKVRDLKRPSVFKANVGIFREGEVVKIKNTKKRSK